MRLEFVPEFRTSLRVWDTRTCRLVPNSGTNSTRRIFCGAHAQSSRPGLGHTVKLCPACAWSCQVAITSHSIPRSQLMLMQWSAGHRLGIIDNACLPILVVARLVPKQMPLITKLASMHAFEDCPGAPRHAGTCSCTIRIRACVSVAMARHCLYICKRGRMLQGAAMMAWTTERRTDLTAQG